MNNLDEIRKQRKITREEFCKKANICMKSYYLYTTGNKPIPSDKLLKFSKILQCSIEFLIGVDKELIVLNTNNELVLSIKNDEVIQHKDYKIKLIE